MVEKLELSLKGTLQKLGKIFASSRILMNIHTILKTHSNTEKNSDLIWFWDI